MRLVFLFLSMIGRVSFAADNEALLAAIVAHPGEDTPRLAYADWLEEHDDAARAEFIRLQIQLARLPWNDAQRGPLEVREHNLLSENQRRWLPKAFGRSSYFEQGSGVQWERGFVHGLTLSGPRFLNSGPMRAAIDGLPLLKSLDIRTENSRNSGVASFVTNLLKLKRLPQLVHLGLHGGLLNVARAAFLAAAPLDRLISLDLNHADVGGPILDAILYARWMQKIRILDLRGIDLLDGTWRLVTSKLVLPELEELRVGWRAWSELASGDGLPKLKRMAVNVATDLTNIRRFVAGPRFRRLSSLDLILLDWLHPDDAKSPLIAELLHAVQGAPHRLAFVGALREEGRYLRRVPVAYPEALAKQIAENAAEVGCGPSLALLSTL